MSPLPTSVNTTGLAARTIFFDEITWLADPAARANANKDENGFATLPDDVVRIRILSRVMPEPRLLFLVRPYDACTRTAPYEPTLKAIRNFSLACKYFHALALLYRRSWPIQVRRYASQLDFSYEMMARLNPNYDAVRNACRKRYGVDPVVFLKSPIPQQAFVNIRLNEDELSPPVHEKLDKFLIPEKNLALRLPEFASTACVDHLLQTVLGQLEELEISENQSEESQEAIAKAFRSSTVLRHCSIDQCGQQLLYALLELKELVSLKLIKPNFPSSYFGNLIDAKFADKLECFALTAMLNGYFQHLFIILPKFAHLLELQLTPANFDERKAQHLAEAIVSLPMLRNLVLNNIDSSAIGPLASMLRDMQGLRQFSAQGNITSDDAAVLLDALSSVQLEQLVLDFKLADATGKILSARLLAPECVLSHLELTSALSLEVARELMRGISGNTSLETLILQLPSQFRHIESFSSSSSSSSSSEDSDADDRLDNPAVAVANLIAQTISEARGLRYLRVSFKNLEPKQVAAIAAALLLSPTVLELDLQDNPWDDKTSARFLEGLKKNFVLLDVRVPEVKNEVTNEIKSLLKRNRMRKSDPNISTS